MDPWMLDHHPLDYITVMWMMLMLMMTTDLCPLDYNTVKVGRGVDGKLTGCVHAKVKPAHIGFELELEIMFQIIKFGDNSNCST